MNNASSTAKVIQVTFNADTQQLTVIEDEMSLETGDTLVWSFANVPDGYSPMVLFNNRQGLGPFAGLRQTEDRLWGEGNIGVVAGSEVRYTYRAALYQTPSDAQTPTMITSDPAYLTNRGSRVTTPTVEVEVDLENGKFDVQPKRCSVFDNTAIVFRFTGVPQDYAPAIAFQRYQPHGEGAWQASPHFGPFTSFCHEDNEILANGSNALEGSYQYIVTLLHLVDGHLVQRKLYRSSDPFIDREEDPLGGVRQS